MTDNTNNQNLPETPVQPKANPASKIAGGLSWWINSLMGKSQPRVQTPPVKQPEQPVAPVQEAAPAAPVKQTPVIPPSAPETRGAVNIEKPVAKTDDPIVQDLQKFKGLLGVFSGKVGEKVKPAVSKGMESTKGAAASYVKTVDKGFIQKALRIFLILILLIALIFIGYRFLKNSGTESPGGVNNVTPGEDQTPTPTLSVINPSNPSVYASDPVILKLEEDINVLVREIEGSEIRETNLNPPRLDFSVTF